MMKLKDIILSWDFIPAFALAVILLLISPSKVSYVLAKEIYTVAITVLSITFPVFFAALAIIITSGDDQFAIFLENHDFYKPIIAAFKYSLCVIFIALIAAITLKILISIRIEIGSVCQGKWIVSLFVSLFAHSLLVGFNAILNAITYAKYRVRYLKAQNQEEAKDYK